MPELRQQPRVVFSGRARIRSEGEDASVVARVHNLSERGIFVTASRPLRMGSEVRCRIFLGEERRVLRGKVAWVRPPDVSPLSDAGTLETGAGIEFTDLARADAERLRRLVTPAPDDERVVDVWFAGLAAPVKCRAVVTREGLRLSTRLPFLRVGSTVKVSLENRGVRETRIGTLDAVVMAPSADERDGSPRLFVGVSTPDADSAGGVIDIASGTDRGDDSLPFIPSTLVDEEALHPSAPNFMATPAPVIAPRAHEQSDKTQRVAMPLPPATSLSAERLGAMVSGRRVRWLPLLVAAVGIAGVMLGASQLRTRHAAPSVASQIVPASSAVVVPSPAATVVPTPANDHAAPPALKAEAPAPTNEAPPTPKAEAPAATSETPPAPKAAAPAAIQVEPMPAPPEPAASAASPVTAAGMTVEETGRRSEIFVALVGSTRKAQSYALRDPPGWAVNVPHARAQSVGRFPSAVNAPVAQVWISRKGVGTQLRFHFAGHVAKKTVTVEAGGVRVIAER